MSDPNDSYFINWHQLQADDRRRMESCSGPSSPHQRTNEEQLLTERGNHELLSEARIPIRTDHECRGPRWELFSSADFVLHFSLHLESMPASSRVMRWIISEGPQNTGHRPITMSQLMLCNYWVLIPFNKWIVEYLNITIHHYHPPSHHLVQMYLCRGQYSNWYCLWSFSEWIIQYVKDGGEFLFQLNSQLEEDIHGDRNVSQHAGMALVFSWWSREGYTWYCILSDNYLAMSIHYILTLGESDECSDARFHQLMLIIKGGKIPEMDMSGLALSAPH